MKLGKLKYNTPFLKRVTLVSGTVVQVKRTEDPDYPYYLQFYDYKSADMNEETLFGLVEVLE